MSMTIKQLLIGTIVGTTVVGLAVHRIRKDRGVREHPTQVASIKAMPVHRKHARTSDVEVSSRKLIG